MKKRKPYRKASITAPDWKFAELIASFGTANELGDRLEKEGFKPPPRHTILGWRQRNSIPGKWLPLLIQLAIWDGNLRDISGLRKTS